MVKSKKANEHVDHLKKRFKRMRHHQLKINPLICTFGVCAGNFLGFLVHQRGIEVDQNKEKAVTLARTPLNKK